MDKELFNEISRQKDIIESRLNSVRKTLQVKTEKYADMVYLFGVYCGKNLGCDSFDFVKATRWIEDMDILESVIKDYNRQFNDLLFKSKQLEKQLEDITNG